MRIPAVAALFLLLSSATFAGPLTSNTSSITRTVAAGLSVSTTVTLLNSSSTAVGWSLTLQRNVAGGWVNVSPVSGSSSSESPGTFSVTFTTEVGMALGAYAGTITIAPAGAPEEDRITIPVTLTVTAAPPMAPPQPPPQPRLDILLRDGSTGELSGWTMNGSERIAAGALDPSPITDLTWSIVGTGDFNGDNQPDIVWQEQTRGDLGVWLMNGRARIRFEALSPSQVGDLGWKIVGVADIDSDGRPDLIWREETRGWLAAWLMDGTTRTAAVSLNPGTVETEWTIVGTGDFNGDGKTDLLWRHQREGFIVAWLMNGVDRLDAVAIDPYQVDDLQWRIAATGDLNGDGRADILWQHDVYGWLYAWLMNGTVRAAGVMPTPSSVDHPGWRVHAITARHPAGSVEALLARRIDRLWGGADLGSVLDVNAHAAWMSEGVGVPSVLVSDDRIRMYFAGNEATGNPYVSRVRIGLATSPDGRRFDLANGGRPVFTEGPAGAFDSHSVSHPMVLAVDGEYWMYYAGSDGTQGTNGVRTERVGLARSLDGVTWRREATPVVEGAPGEVDASQAASPFVLRIGGAFHMWYGAYDGAHRIAYATSPDGIRWTRRGAVAGLRGAGAGELGPSVYFDGRQYLMFYNSVDAASGQWTMYAATSRDGLTWTAAGDGRRVVGDAPEGTFAEAGPGRNSAVHLSGLIPFGNELLAYYVGEDRNSVVRIGLLRFSVF